MKLCKWIYISKGCKPGAGKHWPRKRVYGDVQPWRPPFHASPIVCKGPISSKRAPKSVHKTPFQKNLEILTSTASILLKFELSSPQIWKFQVTRPLFQTQKSVCKPHTLEIWAAHPYLIKRLSAFPGVQAGMEMGYFDSAYWKNRFSQVPHPESSSLCYRPCICNFVLYQWKLFGATVSLSKANLTRTKALVPRAESTRASGSLPCP